MTYEEAVSLKSTIGEFVRVYKETYSVLIVPENPRDLEKFFANYDRHTYTDSTCKQYSTDNEYALHTFLWK